MAATKNSYIVSRVRSGKCFVCDARAAFKESDTTDGVTTDTWWCKEHVDADIVAAANKDNTNTNKEMTDMVATKKPAARKTAPKKPATAPAMATEAKTPRRRPAAKKTTEAPAKPAAPTRKRRPAAKSEPVKATPTRRGRSTVKADAPAAAPADVNVAYVLGAEVDGQMVYVKSITKKDSQIVMTLDAKDALSRKSVATLVGTWTKQAAAAHLNPGVLLNPFNEDDDDDYAVLVYTLRNGRRSTRKDDAPVSLAAAVKG